VQEDNVNCEERALIAQDEKSLAARLRENWAFVLFWYICYFRLLTWFARETLVLVEVLRYRLRGGFTLW
jgi:hypothetical protein